MKKIFLMSVIALLVGAATNVHSGTFIDRMNAEIVVWDFKPSYQIRLAAEESYNLLLAGCVGLAYQAHPDLQDSPRWRERITVMSGFCIGASLLPLVKYSFLKPGLLRATVMLGFLGAGMVQTYKIINRLQPFYPPVITLEAAALEAPIAAAVQPQAEPPVAAALTNAETPAEPAEAFQTEEVAASDENSELTQEDETVEQRRERHAAAALARLNSSAQ